MSDYIKEFIEKEAEGLYPPCDHDSYENENKSKAHISCASVYIERMKGFTYWILTEGWLADAAGDWIHKNAESIDEKISFEKLLELYLQTLNK